MGSDEKEMAIAVPVPDWLAAKVDAMPKFIEREEDRMRAVIELSRINIEKNTGGPFAAGVFERGSGKVIALGVNRVVPTHCSSAHAEIVTLSLAQKRLHSFDLGSEGMPPHQLVVNWRPCAMCFGAIIWAGITSLVIAGSDGQLEEITGFDEGPIHPRWQKKLAERGIALTDGLLTEQACEVFRQFRDQGDLVYNARRTSTQTSQHDRRIR